MREPNRSETTQTSIPMIFFLPTNRRFSSFRCTSQMTATERLLHHRCIETMAKKKGKSCVRVVTRFKNLVVQLDAKAPWRNKKTTTKKRNPAPQYLLNYENTKSEFTATHTKPGLTKINSMPFRWIAWAIMQKWPAVWCYHNTWTGNKR